ncbi:MAG: hypothetical protein J6P20_03430 [Oscillospiraceae bacterium]|nr:hypothetical protein [Oscillospiraceae bacterium]
MISLQEIQNIYQGYFDAVQKAEQNRKITDGMFGFGKKPADDPCHTDFLETLRSILTSETHEKPDSKHIQEILSYIYVSPAEHPEPLSAYWMLIAVHGLTNGLIPLLSKDDAAALLETYSKTYRRWERLPVQKNIIRLLKSQAE